MRKRSNNFYITTPEIDAELDVEVLATAFNMDKVDINVRKIIIDKFDDPNIKLALFDMRFSMCARISGR